MKVLIECVHVCLSANSLLTMFIWPVDIRTGRLKEILKDFPNEECIIILLENELICKCCGTELTSMGREKKCTEVYFIPATVKNIDFYRWEQEWKVIGITLLRSSLANWVIRAARIRQSTTCGGYLVYLYERMPNMNFKLHLGELDVLLPWDEESKKNCKLTH